MQPHAHLAKTLRSTANLYSLVTDYNNVFFFPVASEFECSAKVRLVCYFPPLIDGVRLSSALHSNRVSARLNVTAVDPVPRDLSSVPSRPG